MNTYLTDPSFLRRFWSHIDQSGACWIWTAGKSKAGYGQIGYGRRLVLYAHRVSFELHNGPITGKSVIRHSCDTPACVNPGHLLIGTQRDNVTDMIVRKRHNPHPRLTELQVRDIVSRYLAGDLTPDLAAHFGVDTNEIGRIIRGVRWGHIWTSDEIAQRRELISQRRNYDGWRIRRQKL